MKAISGKESCKILRQKGWRLWHVRGSHHIYEHPDRRAHIPVPVHGNPTLKKGIQHDLMKQAGLTEDDL
jgi:predicted RNA binding protein YcfA (HicA-like mRNA interferase family)